MSDHIYQRLRDQLDQYSIGFPASPSGTEIDILKNLFTPDEAELFLRMGLKAETPEAVAARTDWDVSTVAAMLAGMAEKGTVFCLRRGEALKYSAVPFVLGIYEYQTGRLNREMAALFDRYFNEALHERIATQDVLLRPIPVNRSLNPSFQTASYEDARAIVKKQEKISVMPCLCRVQAGLLGKACDKPLEVCLAFGLGARYFIDHGAGRPVTVEEALGILDQAEEAGLVPQPNNSQDPDAICNCCGCCCAQLAALNKLARPAEAVKSNYFAVVDPELCTGCETCLDRCQMKAIAIDEGGAAKINLDRCIGCGLCVTTCPGQALRLEVKSFDRRVHPSRTAKEHLQNLSVKRGTSLIPLAWSK